MNRDAFNELANVFSEALVLLTSDGQIEAMNRSARMYFGDIPEEQLRSQPISEFVEQRDRLDQFLRSCMRTSSEVIGALQFADQDKPQVAFGRRLSCDGAGSPQILLRVRPPVAAVQHFSVLNDKIDRLNAEIKRRRDADAQLRLERDIAEFGRDIGIGLVRSGPLPSVLKNCCDLMVERLHAALARIWVLEPGGDDLQLMASSGADDRTDGDQARIGVGQSKIGRIALQQSPCISNAVSGDAETHDPDWEWVKQEGITSFAGYPLVVDGGTVGVMAVFSRVPLRDAVAEAMGSVANGIALHIHKHAIEEGLARKTRALQEADRRKDEFLAMLSHELRNPLTPVRTGLDLLALEQSDYRDVVVLMQQQVEHLIRLVDDLLDMSRIMLGKIALRKQPVELNALLRQAYATTKETFAAVDQDITLTLPETSLWINADAVRIKQALENLLRNACKYTDPGGHIELRLRCQEDQAVVEVIDDGIGIEADLLPHIFDLFTQSNRSLDRAQGGLGVGLTLVKNLIELHGGQVTGHSHGLGEGSTFQFRLPTCSASAHLCPDAMEPMEQMPLKILAVDDNRGARLVLARLFERLGPYEVITAEDGPTALAEIDRFAPHLIVLDLGLPGMDGFEIARLIRRKPEGQAVLLVALTGYGQKEDRLKSQEAGFDLHLVKPPAIQQLREILMHPKLTSSSV